MHDREGSRLDVSQKQRLKEMEEKVGGLDSENQIITVFFFISLSFNSFN